MSPESPHSLMSLVVKATSGSIVVKVAGQGGMFLLMILLARLMGAEQYGIYIYALTWMNVIVLLPKLGQDTTLLRYVAEYDGDQNWTLLKGILRKTDQLCWVASFVVGIIGVGVVFVLRDRMTADLYHSLLIGLVTLPFMALSGLRIGATRALKKVVRAQVPPLLLRPAFLGAMVLIVVFLFGRTINSVNVMVLNFIAILAAFVVADAWQKKALGQDVATAKHEYQTPEWIQVALPLLFVSGAALLFRQMDAIMLGGMIGTKEAGLYATASRISGLVRFIGEAVASITAPLMATLYAQKKMADLQHMISRTTLAVMAFAIPMSFFLACFSDVALNFFGEEFEVASTALRLLLVSQLVYSALGAASGYLSMTGHQMIVLRVVLSCLVLNVILNYLLIPLWGMEGAAIATMVSTIVWCIAMFWGAWRKTGIIVTYKPSSTLK